MRVPYNPTSFRVANQVLSSISIPTENPERVFHILAQGDDFKIDEPVVGLVPVFVVHGEAIRDTDKSFGHQAMHISSMFLGSDAENDLFISIDRVNVTMKEPSLLALNARDAANSPEITNLILGEIFNGFPLLHTCNSTTEYM